MKKPHRIALLSCASLPFFGQAQTAQVHIAGSDCPLVFADTNLSADVKQRVASDLTVAFSIARSFGEAKERGIYGMVDAAIPLPGGGTSVTNLTGLYWAGVSKPNRSNTMFCSDEAREGIFLVDYDNQKSVRIAQAVSSNYLHAFALADAHSNAVRKANEFLTALNATDLVAQTVQELRELIHAELWPEYENSDDEIRGFFALVQKFRCLDMSVLNFILQRVPKVNNAEVLVACFGMVDKADPPVEEPRGWVIEFYNGRWGFGRTPLEVADNEKME